MPPPTIDIRIVQLLFSHLCHDLSGPIGAVNNGLELVAELRDGQDAEALDLISESARQASLDIEFGRLAYGFGGGSGSAYMAEAERLSVAVLGNPRIDVEWSVDPAAGEAPKDVAKLTMNMAQAGKQALRGKGRIAVTVASADGGYAIAVLAEGPGAGFGADYAEALAGTADMQSMTPASAQGYLTFALAQLVGGRLETAQDGERVELTVAARPHG